MQADETRPLFPRLAGFHAALSPYGYAVMRASLGAILFLHGLNKLFFGDAARTVPNFVKLGFAEPLVWAYFIGGVEFFGGAMLVLGLATRLAAAAIAIEMAVICFGLLLPAWWWGQHGAEFVVLMGLSAVGIFCRGGGRCSLDRLIGREL